MRSAALDTAVRLLPVIAVLAAVGWWFGEVQDHGPYWVRNVLPLVLLGGLALFTLLRGGGRFTGGGSRMLLGAMGFAVPTLGLSVYLHYAYAVNLNGLFDDAVNPLGVFRYLPLYTIVAGLIGFAIGAIVGRNL